MNSPLQRIISGGQTGADQGGLRAAHVLGIPTGGYAPTGYQTERGPDDTLASYGLVEYGDYPARTKLNVRSSDGTLLVGNTSERGTGLTLDLCNRHQKPVFHLPQLDWDDTRPHVFAEWILRFNTLNVAGNRESKNPGIELATRNFLLEALLNFDDLRSYMERNAAWRDANPGPLIWVTSCQKGQLFHAFTQQGVPTPLPPFGPVSWHYVGRDMARSINYRGSALGNPFADGDRASNIARYAQWMHDVLREPNTPAFRELLNILRYSLEHRGVAIGCWCAPLPCHGDVIKQAVESLYAAGWRGTEFAS